MNGGEPNPESSETADRWTALGLFDPEVDGADQILEVLAFYDSVGLDPAQFAGTDPSDLISAVNGYLLNPSPRISPQEARRRSGLDTGAFEQIALAAGYDPAGEFTDLDAEAFRSFAAATSLFSPEELLHFIRVVGSAMDRIADASTGLFRVDVAAPLDAVGASEVEFAKKNYESSQLTELLFVPMRAFFFHRLLRAIRRSDLGRQAVTSDMTTTLNVTIGFVDIVDYTHLSTEVSPDELAEGMLEFERITHEVVTAHGGRVVKLIGDEVMFVAVEPNDAFNIASELVSILTERLATPCGGVVHGEVVARSGDYYGRIVNLAARLVSEAEAGQVLTDVATSTVASAHRFAEAGERRLKGFDDPIAVFSLE